VELLPSILTADFARLGEEIAALDAAGVDRFHLDVMDGTFVPNISFGPDVIAAIRSATDKPFEAHLMVQRPEELFGRYADAGCQRLLVHPETLRQPHRAYLDVIELGLEVGVGISPATGLEVAHHVLDLVDALLVMTVNPGFGGQSYLASMEAKVAAARRLADSADRPIAVEVDGGIGPDTIAAAAAAGADTFVCGSALWRYPSFADGVADLRARVEAAKGVAAPL
jgi:ribulose-phosphate 3-epimerase